MRPHGGLERINQVAEEMTHAYIGRRRAGPAAANSLVYRVGLAGIAEAGLQQGQMLVLVIGVVEARP